MKCPLCDAYVVWKCINGNKKDYILKRLEQKTHSGLYTIEGGGDIITMLLRDHEARNVSK